MGPGFLPAVGPVAGHPSSAVAAGSPSMLQQTDRQHGDRRQWPSQLDGLPATDRPPHPLEPHLPSPRQHLVQMDRPPHPLEPRLPSPRQQLAQMQQMDRQPPLMDRQLPQPHVPMQADVDRHLQLQHKAQLEAQQQMDRQQLDAATQQHLLLDRQQQMDRQQLDAATQQHRHMQQQQVVMEMERPWGPPDAPAVAHRVCRAGADRTETDKQTNKQTNKPVSRQTDRPILSAVDRPLSSGRWTKKQPSEQTASEQTDRQTDQFSVRLTDCRVVEDGRRSNLARRQPGRKASALCSRQTIILCNEALSLHYDATCLSVNCASEAFLSAGGEDGGPGHAIAVTFREAL
jgi:hypothetical protein